MNWSKLLYLIPYALSFVLSMGIGIYAWRRRTIVGARIFAWYTFAQTSMILFFMTELISPSLQAKIFWDDLQFIGMLFAPIYFLAFAMTYAGRKAPRPKLFWSVLLGIGALFLLLAFTDSLHTLIRPEARLIPQEPFAELYYPFTPTFWRMTLFAYLILSFGIGILIDEFIHPRRAYRTQVVIILVGVAIPVVGSVLAMVGVQLTQHRDTTPFTFAVANLVIAWGLFHHRLFDLIPIARTVVLEQMNDAVIVLDLQSRIVDLNPAARATIGAHTANPIGRPIDAVFPPWTTFVPDELVGARKLREFALERDGQIRHFEVELNPLHSAKSDPLGLLLVLHEITERKAAEIALKQARDDLELRVHARTTELSTANRLLQAASEVSKIAITILEPEDLLHQAVNLIQEHFDFYYVGLFLVDDARRYAVLHAGTGPAGAEMLHQRHQLAVADHSMIGWCINHAQARIALDVELESTRFANPLLPDTRSEMALPLSTRGETIGALTVQSTQNNAFSEQDIAVLQVMADHLATAIANAHLYEAAHLEIAERKRAEREREALIAELEAKNAELERFTYTVSHDLKSPLITIKGFLGYLEQDIASGNAERIHSDINRIANAADTMRDLLNDLLELSRVGRVSNPLEVISMSALAREAVEIVAGQLTAYSVHVDIASDMPEVHGDRARLREVWQNLLSNAAKFMGDQPHPRIEVGTRKTDGKPVFYVRDNGIGIDPRHHDTVFGLFEKLDSNSEGTGIGLTIVKRIVETHGGRIWVESKGIGHGCTFCFTLSFS